jgi:rhodanese-related sulfurtransferase
MEVLRISIDELKHKMGRSERIIFLDARSAKAYAESTVQIPGSQRVPPDQVEGMLDEILRNGLIVPYCTAPKEQQSAIVALALMEDGVRDVKPLLGGLNAWLEAGLPTQPKEEAWA